MKKWWFIVLGVLAVLANGCEARKDAEEAVDRLGKLPQKTEQSLEKAVEQARQNSASVPEKPDRERP